MAFSNILDISSFFIGMLINLMLIALICYYFKKKYETLEMAQNEQAKILYNLIQQQQPKKQFNFDDMIQNNVETINLDKKIESDADSDSDSDSDSDESLEEVDKEVEEVEDVVQEVKNIIITEVDSEEIVESDDPIVVTKLEENDYSKMTIKQLKDILSKKGISSGNKMKKNELIQLIESGSPDTLNLSEELSEVNI